MSNSDRRDFIKTAATGLAVAGAVASTANAYVGHSLTEKEKLARIASNCWPARKLFKNRNGWTGNAAITDDVKEMRKKYGTLTMHDFPQWTKDTYPGVYHMDLWSSVFGNPEDGDQFVETKYTRDGKTRTYYRWDPSKPASVKWLEELANIMVKTGTKCNHISNNAPQNIADTDEEKRKEGVRVAKLWMDAGAILGAKTMRVNTGVSSDGGGRIMPPAEPDPETGYPRNDKIVKYFDQCIKSFRELADYGSKVGVKITIENHWGLCANPLNIKIIIDEVNHPFCEATPDFCNWENEYHLFHGIDILAPYTHTHIHAKYWDRWTTPEKDWNDVQRNVRILNSHGYKGIISIEYEHGPMDDIQGSHYLLKEVLAAL